MSYRFDKETASPVLRGVEGELVFIRVYVDPRSLEDLLEALCSLDFPINPEIRHGHPHTIVEFPAYDRHVGEIRNVIRRAGITGATVELANMMRAIA